MNKQQRSSKFFDLMMGHPTQGVVYLEMNEPRLWNDNIDKETTLDFIFENLVITEVNDAMLDILGATRQEFLGLTPNSIHVSGILVDRNLVANILDDGGRDKDTEIRFANGSTKTLNGDTICLFNEQHQLTGMFSIQKNITNEKVTERNLINRDQFLAASEQSSSFLLSEENLDNGILKCLEVLGKATQVDTIYVYQNVFNEEANSVFCSHRYGWSKLGDKPQIRDSELQNFAFESINPIWFNAFLNGEVKMGPVKNLSKLEQELIEPHGVVSIISVPMFIKGELWGFMGFNDLFFDREWSQGELNILKSCAANIAMAIERDRIQKELEESQELFSQIADNIDEVFYIRSADMKMLYMNKAFETVFSQSIESVINDIGELTKNIHPDNHENLQSILNVETGTFEYKYQHIDGSIRHIANKRFPIYDEDGKISRFVGIMNDVTEVKVAHEELEKALLKEKEVNDLKNRFISMISHEIRTPLTAIVSSAELFEGFSEKLSSEKKTELNQRILKASQKIVNLLEDVLLIGKSDAGKLNPDFMIVDFSELIDNILSEISTTTLKEHSFHKELSCSDCHIQIDKKLVRHILINLLENATKYSAPDSNIWLSVTQESEQLIIKVKDEGRGISVPDLEKIFDPFYRSSEVYEIDGTGLGMAIVKRSLNALKGNILIDSTIGIGTTFTIIIPLNKEQ